MRSSRWRWHLDEVFVRINGVQRYLWRAVDHEGEVLEAFVSKHRDKKAAPKFLRKLRRRHGRAEELMTDGLRFFGAALTELGAQDRQITGRSENNRIGNSRLPCRRREKAMLRIRRMHSPFVLPKKVPCNPVALLRSSSDRRKQGQIVGDHAQDELLLLRSLGPGCEG
jgi:putative transposase